MHNTPTRMKPYEAQQKRKHFITCTQIKHDIIHMMYITKACLQTIPVNSLNKQGKTFKHVSVVYNYAQYGLQTWV